MKAQSAVGIVTEWQVTRFAAATKGDTRILSNHLAVGVRHIYRTPYEERSITNSASGHVYGNGFARAIAANVMQCSRRTLQNCMGDRVGIRSIDVDPWTPPGIEHSRKRLDARCRVNAA